MESNLKIYTLTEVANFLKVSELTVRRFIKKGILKGAKLGGQFRLTNHDINQFLKDNGSSGLFVEGGLPRTKNKKKVKKQPTKAVEVTDEEIKVTEEIEEIEDTDDEWFEDDE